MCACTHVWDSGFVSLQTDWNNPLKTILRVVQARIHSSCEGSPSQPEVGRQHWFQWHHHMVTDLNTEGLLCTQQRRMGQEMMMVPTPKQSRASCHELLTQHQAGRVSFYTLYGHTVTTEFADTHLRCVSRTSPSSHSERSISLKITRATPALLVCSTGVTDWPEDVQTKEPCYLVKNKVF